MAAFPTQGGTLIPKENPVATCSQEEPDVATGLHAEALRKAVLAGRTMARVLRRRRPRSTPTRSEQCEQDVQGRDRQVYGRVHDMGYPMWGEAGPPRQQLSVAGGPSSRTGIYRLPGHHVAWPKPEHIDGGCQRRFQRARRSRYRCFLSSRTVTFER